MAAAKRGRLQREQPFTLRLSRPAPPRLAVRGQIDALLVDEDVTVVDYKLSKARDTARYAASSTPTRWAAHELPLRGPARGATGVVFLRSKGAPFVERVRRRPGDPTRLLDAADHCGRPAHRHVADDRIRSLPQIGCGFIRAATR